MIRKLQRVFLILIVVNAWSLLGIIVTDYLLGNLFGLFTTSIYTQAWAILLLVALSFSPTLWATQLNIKQWCSTTGIGIFLAQSLGTYQAIAIRVLHCLYTNLYLLADVVFCIGAPMLIITASAGWLLLDEVNYLALFGYCCLISLIVLLGLLSNLVRLLSLGYFFGWWLLSADMLLYPFLAPALVQQNIVTMLSGSGYSWLPVIGLVLILYLLIHRDRIYALKVDDKQECCGVIGNLAVLFSMPFGRMLVGSYISLLCLFMAVPMGLLLLNSIMGYLNPHVLFAGFAIWIMDRLWQSDVADEPALSKDFRHFANLVWKH